MQLINKPECPFCWKVRIALAECSLSYESLDFQTEQSKELISQHSLSNSVPVLFDKNIVITDSTVVLEYLEEAYGKGRLLPESISARVKARSVENFSNNIIGQSLREVIFEKRDKPEAEWDHERIERGTQNWRDYLNNLEDWLEPSGYFAEQFSFAECAVIARCALAEHYGVGVDEQHPNVLNWFQTMKERPSYALATAYQ